MFTTILTFAWLLAPNIPAIDVEPPRHCIGEVCFDSRRRIGEADLPLLGASLKRYLFFDVYSIALYGPADARSPGAISSDVPKQLSLYYHRSIDKEDIIRAADTVLRKNPSVDMPALRARLEQLNAKYQDVAKGDRYDLIYQPGVGTKLLFNDTLATVIPGADFGRAYLGIWLSKHPIDRALRDALLGSP